MININNPENYALGIFTAAGAVEERIFIECSDLQGRMNSILDDCQVDENIVDPAVCGRNENLENPDANTLPYCLDCTALQNSTLDEPDFWE